MSSYYDEPDEPDYDSLEYHSAAGYHESMVEDGKEWCEDHQIFFDTGADECPNCGKGESEEINDCWGCKAAEAVTSFMGQGMCSPCYKAAARGEVIRDTCSFADPGGGSALRAAGPGNPRIYACGNCLTPNALTPQDKQRGYQCDSCADQVDRGY